MIRVTQNGMVRQTIAATQERFARLAEAQREVTSGAAIDRISDDPQRGSGILDMKSRVSRTEQYLRNAEVVLRDLQTTESAIGQVNDLVTRVRSLALRASNESLNESDRRALAEQVNQELNELLRIANQKAGSEFLFGGGTRPFEEVLDEENRVVSVEESDSAGVEPNELFVGENELLKGGVSSGEIFEFGGEVDLFQMLISLRDSIESGERDTVTEMVGTLDEALDGIALTTILVGARLASAQYATERLETAKLESTERLSELADADIVESITRYNQEQAYYEMTLRASARVIQPSLINFI